MIQLQRLKNKLANVEKELDKCRTSSFDDGFGTQRHARKARKWDYYAKEKMKLIQQIEDYEIQMQGK